MPKALLNVSGNDADGQPFSYQEGDDVPANHAKSITNPYVFGKDDDPGVVDAPEVKDGLKAWQDYAEANGIETKDAEGKAKSKELLVAEVQSRNLFG